MPTNRKRKKRFLRELIFLLILFAGIGFGASRYMAASARQGMARAVFVRSNGSQTSQFYFHVAANPAQRERGLMFRKPGYLQDNEGMIFLFPEKKIQSFWMKNTYISLDMLFVDSDFKVVGLLENVPVLNTKSRRVDKESLYIVELTAGTAARENISTGAELKMLDELRKPV